ncbi:hypothetical protein HNR31_003138 [Anoxybacillus caldiproteolyticus]|uniref:Uncharacterized protein n=1 Tax=Thermaerobacillus caldiproteolyticus TaxID=247480 RepID=A0A7V9Z9B9_9BACL|nr:hypothetical protein [Anoxybacillus caldiproteolyticus]
MNVLIVQVSSLSVSGNTMVANAINASVVAKRLIDMPHTALYRTRKNNEWIAYD